MKQQIYDQLKQEALNCKNCSLGCWPLDGFDPHVFGQGNLDSKIMFVAENPGKNETEHGQPLTSTGKSGKVFESILDQLNLTRENVYTMNVLICRTPKNRDMTLEEVVKCKPFFKRQLELVKPKLVVTFGRFAASALLGYSKITTDHGKLSYSEEFEVDVFPLYHMAYIKSYGSLLRREEFKQDIIALKKIIGKYESNSV